MSPSGHERNKTDNLRFARSSLDNRLNFAESGHRDPSQIRVLQQARPQAKTNGFQPVTAIWRIQWPVTGAIDNTKGGSRRR